jgi:spermidine synthase
MGSSLVSWIIPLASSRFIEYPVAFLLAALGLSLGGGAKLPNRFTWVRMGFLVIVMAVWPWVLRVTPDSLSGLVAALFGVVGGSCWYRLEKRPLESALLLVTVLTLTPWTDPARVGGSLRFNDRNYYGIYKVFDRDGTRYLHHGTTLHGMQYLDPVRRHEALAYYHATTPVGEFLAQDPLSASSVGIVGLGAGSLAAFGKPGQHFDFLELDPDNEFVARNYFTYLSDSGADIRLIFGDARLSLSKLPDAHYDLLIIDAFNSDSIPVHLLTSEAFSLYARVVRPTGLVMLHVSNKHLDLKPIAAAGALKLGLFARYKINEVPAAGALTSEWVALARSPQAASLLDRLGWSEIDPALVHRTTAWTDRFADPVSAFRR